MRSFRHRFSESVSRIALSGAGILGLSMTAPPADAACSAGSGPNFSIAISCASPYSWTGGNLSIGSGVSLSGGTAGVTSGASTGTLINSGTIAGSTEAISLSGTALNVITVAAIINDAGATILSTGAGAGGINISYSQVGSISNNGLISTVRRGIDNEFSITSLVNNAGGTILATSDRGQDIANNGFISSIVNNGLLIVSGTTPNTDGASNASIAPNPMGIANYQTILSIANAGTIQVSAAASATGIYNGSAATIGTITNTGAILSTASASAGIGNYNSMTLLNNRGTISSSGAGAFGVYNHGGLGSLVNSGTITASGSGAYGIYDRKGTITSLVNTGVISATGSGATAIALSSGSGTIASIASLYNDGTISGQAYALSNSGSLGLVTNNGVIAGNIVSTSQDLSIAGGSNGRTGTLSGYGGGTGTISASGVTLTSGSLFLADTINLGSGSGTVTNNASLQINQAIAVSGNYVQASGGSLVLGVTSASSYGELLVSGSANLTNTHVTLLSVNGASLSAGERFTVVSAGTLSTTGVTAAAPLPYSLSVTGNDLVLSLSSWATRADAAGGNATPIGTALDQLASVTSFQTILSQLSALPTGEQNHALRQLGVSQLTPQVNASNVSAIPTTSAVEQHQLTALDQGASGKAAGSDELRGVALWGQLLGSRALRDTSAGADGYTANSAGLLFGADTHLSADLVSGLAFSWLRTFSRGKSDSAGDRTQIDTYQLSAYGTWRPSAGPAYLQGLLAIAYDQYGQTRSIDYLNSIASAKYGGRQYQAKLGGGYDLPAGGVTVTPTGSLQIIRVENDAYRESGAAAADLSVGRQGFNSAESEFGGKLASDFSSGWGLVSGDVQLSWVHSFTDSPIATSAVIGGANFVSTTARPDTDGTRVRTGITLRNSDQVSVRLEYDGDLRHDYRSHTGLLSVRSEF